MGWDEMGWGGAGYGLTAVKREKFAKAKQSTSKTRLHFHRFKPV